jgi:hypothetical protein
MNNTANCFTFDWDAEVSDETRDKIFDKILWAVNRWRLHLPTMLFFECTGPLSHLGGQAMVVFSPLLALLFPGGISDVQKCVKLLDDPANLKLLTDRIAESESNGTRK